MYTYIYQDTDHSDQIQAIDIQIYILDYLGWMYGCI